MGDSTGSARVPRSTYRLQIHQRFRLRDAAELIDYLDALGIGDLYASPLLTATRGAPHGYHVTDPTRVNPEVGGVGELAQLAMALDDAGMGLLLDIVPNHLAASPENPWWVDVLEHGPASAWAASFDIDWEAGDGRVVLPILGRPEREALERGEIRIALDEAGLHVAYHDTRLPLDPATYPLVLEGEIPVLQETVGASHPAARGLLRVVESARQIPPRIVDDRRSAQQRRKLAEEVNHRLWALLASDPRAQRVVDEALRVLNDPEGVERLEVLLGSQAYRLAFWRTGTEELNYRRFFDITDLVGVRVEDADVFAARHDRLLRLVADGRITGLRVDHVDGLRDPLGYLHELQRTASAAAGVGRFYIVVEKILAGDEPLPEDWPVAGTTGYELLVLVNGLFVAREGLWRLEAAYRRFTGLDAALADIAHDAKLTGLNQLFRGEVKHLSRRLAKLAARLPGGCLGEDVLRSALVVVAASFPVYRTYVRGGELSQRDRPYVETALAEAARRHPDVDRTALDLLGHVLRLEMPTDLDHDTRRDWIEFILRWQQLTGPAMAKGFEDTTFYVYNRLVSLNEVGADVGDMDTPQGVDEFHSRVSERARNWPHTLNATSTHDTKRSEDVRARLHVLTEVVAAWQEHLERWSAWSAGRRREVGGHEAPDRNEEWLLYQTLVGMWPFEADEEGAVRERLKGFALKAAREAKVHTSWLDPDEAHEQALEAFVDAVLDDPRFVDDLRRFVDVVALPGAVNALAQVVAKIAAPGVPDFYQGTELWNLRLVDPDNRRPVDF
ncbi:MAG: malto-oligosyltrehalose synthase, partial [Actinomycetota bacterium]|nr:malto-oligosyltrehalose synthase [Actinomycetota bacterium]